MTRRRLWAILAVTAFMLTVGCTGPSNTPDYTLSAANGVETESPLQTVVMRPEQPSVPPFGATGQTGMKSPAALEALLPAPSQTGKRTSFTPEELTRAGADYDPLLPANQVTAPTDLPGALRFDPSWEPGDGLNEAAFATWQFNLPGYGDGGGLQTLGISLTFDDPAALLLPAVQHTWVGLGNFETDRWDWFPYEEDGVITVESFSPYENEVGNILGILIGLNQPFHLHYLHIGADEMRATGEVHHEFTPQANPFPDFPLQIQVIWDLSPDCSPINDQGGIGSCTAMATADGALNYELGQLYAACGWNFADARLCSPRFVYNQTGADFGSGCPSAGRNTNQVGDWLVDNGTASEFNAPYGSLAASLYNCGTSWSAAALADAELLNADGKVFIGSKHPVTDEWYWDNSNINFVKALIRVAKKPVVFRSDLDSTFGAVDYQGGASWTYSGPRTGGHAMMVVGYDDNRGDGAFKVRNSWGDDWGDEGYCWITYDSMRSSTAGVYGFYFVVSWDEDVADRFCPDPPIFLPPFGFKFLNPQPFGILLEWEMMPGADRYLIYRDDQIEPIGFASSTENSWMDGNVPDNLTHVYWIRAVYGNENSAFSPPIFGYQTGGSGG